MKQVEIYTDGASIPNPGKSGAGIVMLHKGIERRETVYLGYGTNQTAELLAVIHALNFLKEPCKVTVYSDSQYVVKCGNGEWGRGANTELWQAYDKASARHSVTLKWIRKDSHLHNQTAHKLANEGANRGE